MKICIIGQGYIGLPTAALFADNGCEVVGVDINEDIIRTLNEGKIHIEEPGIQQIINKAAKSGSYHASLKPEEADVFIITVPTPFIAEDLSCDLSYVINGCRSIVPFLKKGNVVIIESTIAPMSTDNQIKPIFEDAGFEIGKDLYLAHCPERVLPGKIIEELIHNDRIIGGITPECSDKAAEVYATFVKGKLMKTEAKTAEMSKCMDPGPGVGGHCLAIDPYFIYSEAPDTARIIKLARDTNNSMPKFVAEKTREIIKNHTSMYKPKIAVLGVAYKGNTGDARESPAFEIIQRLQSNGYEIAIHDPHIQNNHYVSLEDALESASIALILADHNEFKELDYDLVSSKMKNPIIFDTKNIVKNCPEEIELFNYGNLYQI